MECKHIRLRKIGVQSAGQGVNVYYMCEECGSVIVVPPDKSSIYIIPKAEDSDLKDKM